MAVYFDADSLKLWTIQLRYYMDLFDAIIEKQKKINKKKEILI